MKKNTTKKVLNYAAMSAAILGTADAAGQIVYTDIADVTLTAAGEFEAIDFDNDGTEDILIGLLNFTGGPGAVANGASDPANPTSFNGNGIVGVEAGGFYYPSNLTAGVTIDDSSPIINSVRGDMYVYACYPNSQWCGEVTDGFVGAEFDVAGETHYGWVRLDVLSNGGGGVGTIIVKDFAYDATPNTAVVTGETVLGVNDNNFEGFSYFVDADNNLNLKAANAMSDIKIFNVHGQSVIANELSKKSETISIDQLSAGMYIAQINIDGASKAIKILKK